MTLLATTALRDERSDSDLTKDIAKDWLLRERAKGRED
jgi:hypothetical protein